MYLTSVKPELDFDQPYFGMPIPLHPGLYLEVVKAEMGTLSSHFSLANRARKKLISSNGHMLRRIDNLKQRTKEAKQAMDHTLYRWKGYVSCLRKLFICSVVRSQDYKPFLFLL